MAQQDTTYQISDLAQANIIAFVKSIIARRNTNEELRTKMEIIDQAYARYKGDDQLDQGLDATGRDVAGTECCGNVFGQDNIVAPIVVAQVDSMVAYLADVFLSGYPLFPVVSPPGKRKWAEQLETLIDDHANLGGYVRQILMMLKDGVKYNISAIEVDWSSIEQFSVSSDFTESTGRKVERTAKAFNKLKRLDPYNILYDLACNPGDVAAEGDYAGYLEVISKTKLKRLTTKMNKEGKGMNFKAALNSFRNLPHAPTSDVASGNYRIHPSVSEYITARSPSQQTDWAVYLGKPAQGKRDIINLYDGSSYEKCTVYARILPSDLGIKAPNPHITQIWKFVIINMTTVIEATRIISAYDYLPILFGQPMEDGLGLQTQSTAEGSIPFQEAATTLFNIRFAAARRSISDRALYNPDLINPSDVNSPTPAPKIPVRLKTLTNATLDSAYKPIPFDMRGTESTINDARVIVGFSQELSGINGPQQGQFQKGNKSVTEWNDTLAGSDNRLRLPAMTLECQVFSPMKQMMALNIFQYGENAQIVSQRTGTVIDINVDELRNQVLSFRIADGYSPKSKLASVEALGTGMNMLMNSPILQESFGSSLPNMFLHMMQLAGVRDMEQYSPDYQPAQTPPAGLAGNTLQGQGEQAAQPPGAVAVDPTTGVPAASTPPSLPVA